MGDLSSTRNNFIVVSPVEILTCSAIAKSCYTAYNPAPQILTVYVFPTYLQKFFQVSVLLDNFDRDTFTLRRLFSERTTILTRKHLRENA